MVKTLHFHCKGNWVRSLIRELNTHKPCGVAQKMKKKKCVCVSLFAIQQKLAQNCHSTLQFVGGLVRIPPYFPLTRKDPPGHSVSADLRAQILPAKAHHQLPLLSVG